MRNDSFYHQESVPDPLSEFLAQLLADTPDVLPIPLIKPTPVYPSSFAFAPAPHPPIYSYLTCHWISPGDPPIKCSAPLSQDPRLVCEHLRWAHNVRGNERVHTNCHWLGCAASPMRRGSIVRHVLTVHLGLLKWRCEVCGREFSRKGTRHACTGVDVEEG